MRLDLLLQTVVKPQLTIRRHCLRKRHALESMPTRLIAQSEYLAKINPRANDVIEKRSTLVSGVSHALTSDIAI